MSDSNPVDSAGIRNIMSRIHASLAELDEMTQSAQNNPELRKEIQDFRSNVLEHFLDRLHSNGLVPGERAIDQGTGEMSEAVLPEENDQGAVDLDEAYSDYSPDVGTNGNVLC